MTALQPRGSAQTLPLPRSYSAPDGARKPATGRPPPRAELRAVLERAQLVGATGTDAAVLAALWTHADRHGGCWPSQRRLATLTGRCERTVRTSVQRLAALGMIVRAVPAPASRRWGWTDPTTGKRRGSRRSTVYTLTGDASREPRPVATIGADAEPSPEIVAAVARVEAAHAAALARLDAPELLWCGVEAVDLVLADDAVDLVLAPAAVDVAELELSPADAPERVDVVICEMLHTAMLREKQLAVIASFKKRYLERFGGPLPIYIPEAAVMAVQPVYASYDFHPDRFRRAYRRHVEDVTRYFEGRPNDLLILNVAARWRSMRCLAHVRLIDWYY